MAQGTGRGATLWGLLMFPHPLPARVGDQEKIVGRMTGTGPLTLTAIDPAGMNHQPAWGPATHLSGERDKPGDEWVRVTSSLSPVAGTLDALDTPPTLPSRKSR
jgi:hypothetical protein